MKGLLGAFAVAVVRPFADTAQSNNPLSATPSDAKTVRGCAATPNTGNKFSTAAAVHPHQCNTTKASSSTLEQKLAQLGIVRRDLQQHKDKSYGKNRKPREQKHSQWQLVQKVHFWTPRLVVQYSLDTGLDWITAVNSSVRPRECLNRDS